MKKIKKVADLRSKKHYEHIRIKGVKRYCQLQDLMHKAGRLAVSFCSAHDLGRIVIGTNRNRKQSVNLSKRNNQNFVMLPHAKFIEMVRYKIEEYGIQVTVREESCTSKAGAPDMDVIFDFDPK